MDNSMNRQLQAAGIQENIPQNAFNRFKRTDQQLQNEYNQFASQKPSSQGFAGSSINERQSISPQFQQRQNGSEQWVSDFQRMSIQDNGIQRQQVQMITNARQSANIIGQSRQWSSEFGQMERRETQMQNSDNFNVQSANNVFTQSYLGSTGIVGNMYQHDNMATGINHQAPANHDSEFDSAFADVESQLASQNQQNTAKDTNMDETQKEKLAQIAQSVFDTMTQSSANVPQETSEKFKNSKFLNLMDRIAKREVEINDKHDKFIDSKGHDIRDDLPDPLRDLRN